MAMAIKDIMTSVREPKDAEITKTVGPGPINIRPDRQIFELVGPADRQKTADLQEMLICRTDKKSAVPTKF